MKEFLLARKRYLSCLLMLCLTLWGHVYAQQRNVTGTVTDGPTKDPLPGVSVLVQGSSTGTITDANGSYTISVSSDDAVLVFTFVGYAKSEIKVGSQSTIDVPLAADITSLQEIVVVGYGEQKKSVVTGSITSVKASDLENMPITRVEQALQGRTSGLTIAASSGQPGSSSTVRIRGTTSLNFSDPLYVVDGVPIDVGGIDYLNQNDIESIEVLKDAASAAIYGTRAANGVILITTKKGKAGSLQVNYSGYYGTQAPARKIQLLNATQYATLRNEASVADGKGLVFENPSALGKGTDWQKLIFNNNAKIQNHDLSISGGSDKSTYYASFGYLNQEGIVATDISKYERLNVRFNSSHKVTSWFRFGNNIGYSHINNKGIGSTNNEFGGILSSAVNLDPITPAIVTDPAVAADVPYSNHPYAVKDANGNPYGISQIVMQEMSNPLAYIKTHLGNHGFSDNIVGNAYVELEPLKGLVVKSNIGAKLAYWGSESFTPLAYFNSVSSNSTNNFYREQNRGLIWNFDNTIAYSRNFDKHSFGLLGGVSAYSEGQVYLNTTYRNLPINTFKEASMNYANAVSDRVGGGGESVKHSVSSVFARLNYNYSEKYLFTGIIRKDGSTRFGSNNKYGYFPSASVGWVPSLENFWPANNVVNFLKVRGSYGVTGNDNIGDFKYLATVSGGRNYTFGQDSLRIGYSPNASPNPSLRWEQTTQSNVGFEATVLQNISVTFDIYDKKTTGILQDIDIPGYVGTGKPAGNVADMENRGVELELGYHKQIGEVNFSMKGNVSYLQNRVTYLGMGKKYLDGGATVQSTAYSISRTAVGHAIGSFYGFQTLGIFQNQQEINSYTNKEGTVIQPNAAPGDFRFADLDGNGKIDASDRKFIGDPTPNWSFGVTLNAAWKGFDFLAFGQGVAGNDVYQGLRRLDIGNANWSTKALSRWTGEGTSNSYPRLITSDPNKNFSNPSNFQLESGAYFRIKTVQIGYTIPKAMVTKAHLNRVRIYIGSNNLYTFTKYSGFDPEIGGGSYGIDRGYYPQARSFMAGLNVGF